MNLFDALKELNHHAYLLIGDVRSTGIDENARPRIQSEIISVLEALHDIRPVGNPDFFAQDYQTFTIDDSRAIKTAHEMRPMTERGKKIFILGMNAITVEAQNALLKLLEEPAEYAHFFLIVPSEHLLLPTVKSRVFKIGESGRGEMAPADLKIAKEFLKSDKAKRMEMIKELTDRIAKEKATKSEAIELLNGIEQVLYEKGTLAKDAKSYEAIEFARKYINDRAPSVKMLLEGLALSIGAE